MDGHETIIPAHGCKINPICWQVRAGMIWEVSTHPVTRQTFTDKLPSRGKSMQIAIVTAILVITLILLISEKLPLDVTAIAIMVALMVSGILTPVQAVAGFANPAVITVAAMFLISQAMIRTGAVGEIGQKVLALARGKVRLAIVIILLIVGIASAFINNTPVVVLFIPVILSMGCRFGVSPSKYLIPLS